MAVFVLFNLKNSIIDNCNVSYEGNFEGNAKFLEEKEGMVNVTPFEFIPYILSMATTVDEAKEILENVNLVNINLAVVLLAQFFNHWSERLARSAPRRIKVNQRGAWSYELPFARIGFVVIYFTEESSSCQIHCCHNKSVFI